MVDRESARFRAQQQRQMESIITKPRNPCEGPKFSEPIKTDKEDKSIQDILGSFSKIKNVMEPSSMNNFLGIPKEPQTPVDNKTRLLFDSPGVNFTPNGQVKGSKSGSQSTSGSSSKRDQSGSSATKSGVPYAKSGHKSKEAAKQAVKQEPQASKGRPGGSSLVSAPPAPGRGISPVPTTKGKRQKDEDVKVHIKKEKDLDPGKPLDTSSSSSSSGSSSSGSSSGSRKTAKVKPSSGASSDSNSKSLPKKGSTPVKSKSSSSKSDTKPVLNAAKKEFKRPNGVVNHHQLAHAGLDATDSSKNPETVSVKQEPCAVKEEPKDCLAGGGDELGAGLFASIAKNLFGDPPDSTTEKRPDFKKEKLMVPKLNIPPSLASFRDPSKQEVEKILNMMTENKSPLTAIQNTPIKGDASCKFHFLASTPVTKSSDNLLQVPAPVKPSMVNVKQEVKVKPSSPIRETAPPEKPVKPE
ncbi:serine/arginine repetitive matrix protein 2-like [Patiria miniata]|uniref:Uncharacterized protein n=1 Tax=Patiria miniata TaxID=46514 RepID=A0A913ZXX2_PATMI|nr:serine/arginine repetitive matrix protein 2-like [Patiria miniata]